MFGVSKQLVEVWVMIAGCLLFCVYWWLDVACWFLLGSDGVWSGFCTVSVYCDVVLHCRNFLFGGGLWVTEF